MQTIAPILAVLDYHVYTCPISDNMIMEVNVVSTTISALDFFPCFITRWDSIFIHTSMSESTRDSFMDSSHHVEAHKQSRKCCGGCCVSQSSIRVETIITDIVRWLFPNAINCRRDMEWPSFYELDGSLLGNTKVR